MQIDNERLKERVKNFLSDDFCNEDHDNHEGCLTCEREARKIIQAQQAQEVKLAAIVKELREALEYYANNKHWYLYEGISDIVSYPVVREKGDVAKQALLRAEQLEGK